MSKWEERLRRVRPDDFIDTEFTDQVMRDVQNINLSSRKQSIGSLLKLVAPAFSVIVVLLVGVLVLPSAEIELEKMASNTIPVQEQSESVIEPEILTQLPETTASVSEAQSVIAEITNSLEADLVELDFDDDFDDSLLSDASLFN